MQSSFANTMSLSLNLLPRIFSRQPLSSYRLCSVYKHSLLNRRKLLVPLRPSRRFAKYQLRFQRPLERYVPLGCHARIDHGAKMLEVAAQPFSFEGGPNCELVSRWKERYYNEKRVIMVGSEEWRSPEEVKAATRGTHLQIGSCRWIVRPLKECGQQLGSLHSTKLALVHQTHIVETCQRTRGAWLRKPSKAPDQRRRAPLIDISVTDIPSSALNKARASSSRYSKGSHEIQCQHTVPYAPRKPGIRGPTIFSNSSGGSDALEASKAISHSFWCWSLRRTTQRAVWLLKALGTWSTACLTISSMRLSGMVVSLARA